MGTPKIKVHDLDDFTGYIKTIGQPPKKLSADPMNNAIVGVSPTESLAEPMDKHFREQQYFHDSVDYQSKQVSLFVSDVHKTYPGLVDIIGFVSGNYHKAEVDSGELLQTKLKAGDVKSLAKIAEDNDLKHDPHGWTDPGKPVGWTGLDTQDTYTGEKEMGRKLPERAKDNGGVTDWEKDEPGETFANVEWVFNRLEPGRLESRIERWNDVADALTSTHKDLFKPTGELKNGWHSPAASAFGNRMDEAFHSITHWAGEVRSRAATFKLVVNAIKVDVKLINGYRKLWNEQLEIIEKIYTPRTKPNQWDYNKDKEELAKRYDEIAVSLANLLGTYFSKLAPYTMPPRYPGFVSNKPLAALPPPTQQPVVPGGGGGGGGGNGKTPKVPGPGKNDIQKQIDDIIKRYEKALADQKKAYEQAMKELRDAMAEMKKNYDKLLKEQAEAAQKQIEALQKAMQEQQQGAQQQLQDAMQARDDLAAGLGGTQQNIDDLTKKLGETITGSGLDPSILGPLSALPALVGGGMGGFGSPGFGGLPTASGGMDLMGRGGALPGTSTGLGATALTGRAPVGAGAGGMGGMGGVPYLPPMGGQPMGGAGGGGLAGRKGRPSIPDQDKKKPVTRPRIVDPAGDGTTEAAATVREGERRATVARPAKAPEAESGQALGRTA